jgi:carbamate kinase
VVIALGGNAILQPGQVGTFEEQLFNIDGAMGRIAQLAEEGWRVVLTHGNGPQVGNLLIQNALAARTVAPMPMDVCGAMSQGQIGYMAAQTLANHLRKRRLQTPVVTIVTQVAVDPRDTAFAAPSKPVGPFYSEAEARKMMLEEGLAMREDAGRGWRRVVPSPEPKEIVELEAVRDLSEAGCLVVCSGGGGVPVVRSRGALAGIDAVIDKDLAAALLARELGADALLILTDVPRAYVHYGTPEQTALERVTASQMRAYAAAGHFKAGSMGPKVEACLRFVDAGGESIIASLTEVGPALAGKAGTHIVPDGAAKKAAKRGARRTPANATHNRHRRLPEAVAEEVVS